MSLTESILDKQRISEETLNKFYYSLTDLINEYLHSFKDEDHKTFLICNELTDKLCQMVMNQLKFLLDQVAICIEMEQEK